MRPVSKDFQKFKFVIGGFFNGETILWVWYKNNEIACVYYRGSSSLAESSYTKSLEVAFEVGEISLKTFVKKIKASSFDKASSIDTIKNCVAPLLKPHQIFSLWEALKVHTWQSSYFAPILDGTQWELTYETNGKTYRVDGSNAYPLQWEKFIDFLTLFTPKLQEFRDYNVTP